MTESEGITMEYAVRIKNLSKQYPDFSLNNISLDIPKGSIMGLIGENGSGKSTTIKAMLDIVKRDTGEVEILGMDIREREQDIKEEIGAVFSESQFHDFLNAVQISGIMKRIYKNWDEELFSSYLSRFALPEKKKVKEYSRGMTMKLAIAAALSHHPKLLILDEATSGLDTVARDEILDLFFEFIEDGEHSVLIASHITSDLDKVADYITMIHNGSILFSDSWERYCEKKISGACGGPDEHRGNHAVFREEGSKMTGLLIKDLYIMRQSIKSMLFILVVWSVVFLGGKKTGMFLIPMFIMIAGMNVLNLFAYDRQTKWETYALTMPIPRWKMVLEKYLYSVCIAAFFGIIAVAAVAAATAIKGMGMGPEFLFELLINWLTGVVLAFFYNSISIPLTYWLGVEKARMIPSVLIGVAVFLIVALASAYGDDIAVSDSTVTAVIIAGALGTVVMMVLSYFISVSVYNKKEF